jgi:O-antigen/teichoic acid export membrane protein
MPILISPIITRLYTPEDFGRFAIFSSVLGIVGPIASLRYDYAIVLPARESTAEILTIISVYVALCTSLALLVMQLVIAQLASYPTMRSFAVGIMLLITVAMCMTGIYQALSTLSLRHKQYRLIAKTRVQQGIGTCIIQLIGGLFSLGPIGLALGSISGQSTGASSLFQYAWKSGRLRKSVTRFRRLNLYALKYSAFPLWSSTSSFINAIAMSIPSGAIALIFGPAEGGFFMLSQRVMGAPLSLLGGAVGQVYEAEASAISRQSKRELRSRFWWTARRLGLVGLLCIIPVGLLAGSSIPIIFGKRWGPATPYLLAMSPLFIAQFANSPLSQTLVILRHLRLQFILDVVRLAVMVTVFLWAELMRPLPLLAVQVYSGTMCFCYLCYFTSYAWAVRYHARQEAHSEECDKTSDQEEPVAS